MPKTPVYGTGSDNNRWWAGFNASQCASNVNFDLSTPNGYESMSSGNAADDALFVAASRKSVAPDPCKATKAQTTEVESKPWVNVTGSSPGVPFATQALADAAVTKLQKAHPSPSLASNTPAVLGGVFQLPASIGNFFAALGDANTWIRIAKVVIGGALVIIGLAHMTGAENAVASAARNVPLPIL